VEGRKEREKRKEKRRKGGDGRRKGSKLNRTKGKRKVGLCTRKKNFLCKYI